ncbi:MAG: hypothetical protein LKM43_03170 [Wolbachia endosymbiont of Penenirmus auritus]|nr:hypothetical protein [Wolbachia endosymbiont of Penenirmus auritus]
MSNLIDLTLSIPAGIGMLTGATTGLVCYALGTTLSPLVIGSAAAIVSTVLSSVFFVGFASIFDGGSPNYKRNAAVLFSVLCFPGIAVGIGLSAAINSIPGIILDIESAAKLGTAMGVIAPLTGFFIASAIVMPAIEKIKKYFSSQEKNSDTHTIEESDKPSNTLESVDPSGIKGEDKNLVAAKT